MGTYTKYSSSIPDAQLAPATAGLGTWHDEPSLIDARHALEYVIVSVAVDLTQGCRWHDCDYCYCDGIIVIIVIMMALLLLLLHGGGRSEAGLQMA